MLKLFFNGLLFASLLVGSNASFACPQNGALVDYNCDGQIKYVFTGDSIVAGKGDTRRQGYVGRLASSLPNVKLQNLGIGGMRAYQLVAAFRTKHRDHSDGNMLKKSDHADFVMIDVGRNDYLGKKTPPQVIREIRRLVNFLSNELGNSDGTPPLIAVATLLPVSSVRGQLQTFAREVNKLLLREKQNSRLPVIIRFDRIPSALISRDGLHPSPAGFIAMTEMVDTFVRTELQNEMHARRLDSDGDGTYDIFEVIKYFTNPSIWDTDQDGVNDGEEIFIRGTNPRVADNIT